MKKIGLALAAAATSVLFTTAAPAQADHNNGEDQYNEGCISYAEYEDIHVGWRRITVHNYIETSGITYDDNGDLYMLYEYPKCNNVWNTVYLTYKKVDGVYVLDDKHVWL